MANLYWGEVPITCNAISGALRPTFQAICELESMTGKTVEQLANLLEGKGLTDEQLWATLACGLRASGENTASLTYIKNHFDQNSKSPDLQRSIMRFYLAALGHSEVLAQSVHYKGDWMIHLAQALAVGMITEQFWRMTPQEFGQILHFHNAQQSGNTIDTQSFEKLKKQFPDR